MYARPSSLPQACFAAKESKWISRSGALVVKLVSTVVNLEYAIILDARDALKRMEAVFELIFKSHASFCSIYCMDSVPFPVLPSILKCFLVYRSTLGALHP
jgi:hypothetical protein